MNIAAECRGFRALTLYFCACSWWYAWFIALSSHFATLRTCVAFGDAIPLSLLQLCENPWERGLLITILLLLLLLLQRGLLITILLLLLTYGSIPYGVSSIRGYVVECPSSTIGTKIPWGVSVPNRKCDQIDHLNSVFLFCLVDWSCVLWL